MFSPPGSPRPQVNRGNALVTTWIIFLTILTASQVILYVSDNSAEIENEIPHVRASVKTEEKIQDSSLRPKIKEQPFNYTNPFYDSWCPYAKCYNSPVCVPCDRRFLFILATGRSGSTTLLKMFDSLPGVRLAGENLNELYLAAQLYKNIKHDNHFVNDMWVAKGRYMKPKIDGPFQHNALPIGALSCVSQHLVSALNPPELPEDTFEMEDDSKTILGMKLIRIQRGDWKPSEAATFLKENFPCARYIVNVRTDIEEQVDSYKNNFHWDVPSDTLKNETEFLQKLHVELGHSSYQLNMEEWIDNPRILNKVLDWLGYENCKFNTILHENHDGYEIDTEHTLDLGANCIYPNY